MHSRNPEIIELSEFLNKLQIETNRPNEEKFRNPNGVGLKLNNFKAIDPSYEGAGIMYSGIRTEAYWKEIVYFNNYLVPIFVSTRWTQVPTKPLNIIIDMDL